MLLVSTWPGRTQAAAEASDYVMSPVPGAPSAQTSRATSKFEFMFSPAAKWPGALVWYYNHAGAPVQFSDAKEAVIQQIVAQSAKWTAACGIQIEYGGETEDRVRSWLETELATLFGSQERAVSFGGYIQVMRRH